MIELDNLHYSYRPVDGYQKPFNFIMSPREPGKTTMMWLTKIYLNWKKDKAPWIYMTRNVVDISEALITSIQDTILNKFTDDNVELQYTKGTFKDGIVDVKINGEIFFRIVALSIPLRRIKLAVLKGVAGVFMDEYIINPKSGEKYIKDEAYKIKEAYTTWRREAKGILKMYFCGNPYSLYNPLFMDWGVDTNKLKKNSFYVGEEFVIHWAILTPELRNHLLEVNPLYKFDEDYSDYALEGSAVNDKNIKLSSFPSNYNLQYIFRMNEKYIGVFKNRMIIDEDNRFYCSILESVGKYRNVYCFDFEDLIDRCALLSREDRDKFSHFKKAMQRNQVAFSSIETYYLIIEIYNFI